MVGLADKRMLDEASISDRNGLTKVGKQPEN